MQKQKPDLGSVWSKFTAVLLCKPDSASGFSRLVQLFFNNNFLFYGRCLYIYLPIKIFTDLGIRPVMFSSLERSGKRLVIIIQSIFNVFFVINSSALQLQLLKPTYCQSCEDVLFTSGKEEASVMTGQWCAVTVVSWKVSVETERHPAGSVNKTHNCENNHVLLSPVMTRKSSTRSEPHLLRYYLC